MGDFDSESCGFPETQIGVESKQYVLINFVRRRLKKIEAINVSHIPSAFYAAIKKFSYACL